MKKILMILLTFLCFMGLFAGCSSLGITQNGGDGMKDGYYTAEMEDYYNGWKEFVTICVKGGKIVSVEYNAKNESGFIKSWDIAYMRIMDSLKGTYPNRYTREYAKQVVANQSAEEIDTVTGATTSGKSFTRLIEAAITASRAKDSNVAIVSMQE